MSTLKNTTISDTGSLKIPSGTTAQRSITAYTTPGSYTWTAPTGVTRIQVLVVAGGGGGGAPGGGGGGGGGVLYNSSYAVNPGSNYSVVVGNGGTGGVYTVSPGGTGGNSVFDTLTAYGGGGGGGNSIGATNGGSGGGQSGNFTGIAPGPGIIGQGNSGGTGANGTSNNNGGGGGAGTAGISAVGSTNISGNGGQGLLYAITGTPTWYGGGGGGGSQTGTPGTGGFGGGGGGSQGTATPGNGSPNTGGGGGGAGAGSGAGGTGGSGVVIIRYTAEIIEIFSKPGTVSWTAPADVSTVEVLVVGGGGAASGGDYATGGGGGGGGGVQYTSSYAVTPGSSYTVTVGAGGIGAANAPGSQGGSSTFDTITCSGGGIGAAYPGTPSTSGSSGGGGTWNQRNGAAGITGQGYPGGSLATDYRTGGGGGGAGGAGGDGVNLYAGNGGPGLPCNITGTIQYYGGGGGGGCADWTDPPLTSGRKAGKGGIGGGGGGGCATGTTGVSIRGQHGQPGTGGGGGGSAYNVSSANATACSSANGGSGVVILKYNGQPNAASNAKGLIRYNTTNSNTEIYKGVASNWYSTTTVNDIVGDGLFFHVDAGNKKSKVFYPSKSLTLDDKTWNLGQGDVGQFSLNGNLNENYRIIDSDPWGNRAIIWEARSSGDGNGDGGWNTSMFNINPYKTYRFSQWMRRKGTRYTAVGGGSMYFGTNNVSNTNDQSFNGNPYFIAGGWPWQANQWYLQVAHVHQFQRANSSVLHPDSGWYTVETGTYNLSQSMLVDYQLRTDYTQINQRTYLYYTADAVTQQQFYRPRVDCIDGTEPSISQLLRNDPIDPDIWYDIKGINHLLMWNGVGYNSNNGGSLTFNGSNQYCQTQLTQQMSFPTGGTFEMWVQITASKPQGFLSAVAPPTYIDFYMDTSNKMRWEVIGTTGVSYSTVFSTTTFNLGQWYHVVGTFDPAAQTLSIYINGVLENQLTGYTNMPGSASYTSYVSFGNYGGYLNGKGAINRIYTRPLTLNEINQNFNAERGRFGI